MGPLKIERTEVVSPDILVADLGGAVHARVAVVKEKGKFFVKAPQELGGKLEQVPAASLTDCLNYKAWEWNKEIEGKKELENKKEGARKGDREKTA